MNSFLTKIIIQLSQPKEQKGLDNKGQYSNYRLAKAYRHSVLLMKRNIKDFILITAGIFSAAFGFKVFLLTNNIID